MSRNNKSVNDAEDLVEDLIKTKDIKTFLSRFSDHVSWYGRFNRWNRTCLTCAVIDYIELSGMKVVFPKTAKIKNKKGDKNV
jgi:hypothetical protein